MAENKNIKGSINSLDAYHTDAYMIAVKNGFKGTEAEWLESLKGSDGTDGAKGDKGDKGDTGATGEKGDKGDAGADGVGIVDIAKTNTSGLIDTYTITLTDGTTKTFVVKNGADGSGGEMETMTREEMLDILNGGDN